jgi:hypothetical protein
MADWDAPLDEEDVDASVSDSIPDRPNMTWIRRVLGDDADFEQSASDGVFQGKASVAVAVRIRPLSERERQEGSSVVMCAASTQSVAVRQEVRA